MGWVAPARAVVALHPYHPLTALFSILILLRLLHVVESPSFPHDAVAVEGAVQFGLVLLVGRRHAFPIFPLQRSGVRYPASVEFDGGIACGDVLGR